MIDVRAIAARETWTLRQRVLRPHQRLEEMNFPGDSAPDTVHFGAFDGPRLVGIASLYRAPMKGYDDGRAWQLRGMATDATVRGKGFGDVLMRRCVEHVIAAGGVLLWCNARVSALGFYERHGLKTVGEPFELPGIGPHNVMMLDTSANRPSEITGASSS